MRFKVRITRTALQELDQSLKGLKEAHVSPLKFNIYYFLKILYVKRLKVNF